MLGRRGFLGSLLGAMGLGFLIPKPKTLLVKTFKIKEYSLESVSANMEACFKYGIYPKMFIYKKKIFNGEEQ